MAVAARQLAGMRPRRPRLRLVASRPKNGVRAYERARRNFALFATLVAVVAAVGVARVWVSVRAIEASFEASQLRADIRSERYEGDMLEVRQSALGSPSRIREIAGRAMDMAPADQVTYLKLRDAAKVENKVSQAGIGDITVLKKVVAAFKELTAGEAEMLLVGDVGLTSTR